MRVRVRSVLTPDRALSGARREAEEAVLGVFGDAQVAVAVAAAEVRFGERVRGEHETKEDSSTHSFSFVCVRVFLCLRESLPSRFVPSMIFEPGRLRAGQTPSIDDAAAPHETWPAYLFSPQSCDAARQAVRPIWRHK